MRLARLFGLNALIRLGASASGQLFAFYLAELALRDTSRGAILVGALGACFYLTELLGAPLFGRRADRLGALRVLAWGPLFGMGAGFAAIAASRLGAGWLPAVVVLAVARVAEGLSAASSAPATLALLSRATEGDETRRTRLMGAFEISSLFAMIAGYIVAGVSWDLGGTRAFLALPLVYSAARLSLGRIPKALEAALPSAEKRRPDGLWGTLRRPGNLAFGIAWLAVNAVVGVWLQQAPFLLKLPERSPTQALVGGFRGAEIGAVFAAWGLAFLLGLAGWSVAAPRWSRPRIMQVALLGMIGVVLFLGLANHGAGPWALAGALLCILVESGFSPTALAHLASITQAREQHRGATLGLYSLLLGAGQLLGNLVGIPFAARWQMDGVLGLTGGLAVLALWMLHRLPESPVSPRQG